MADSFLCGGHVIQHTDNAEILVVYDVTNLEMRIMHAYMLAMQAYYIVDKQTEGFIKITIYLILEESRRTVILKV